VVVVGFPGESWQGHQAVTREAKILDTKRPTGERNGCSFPDSVQQGNSGGPLLDGSGNVIGVVVAKAELHTYDPDDNNNREISMRKSDIAISWPIVRKFLEDNRILYQEADSGIYLSADRVTTAQRIRS